MQVVIKRGHLRMVSIILLYPFYVNGQQFSSFLLQAAGIAFTYVVVLVQFYLNQDLIDKYRATFAVALNRGVN